MNDNELITGNEFINKFFDLKSLESNYDEWTVEGLKGNDPRYYRLLQIISILKYLNIDSVDDFVTGKFFNKKDKTYYQCIFKSAHTYLSSKHPHIRDGFDLNSNGVTHAFITILEYREKLNSLLYHQSGVLEASGMNLWAYESVSDANIYLDYSVKYINKLLTQFINPTNEIRIPINELVVNFGYPNVNLWSIDADNY